MKHSKKIIASAAVCAVLGLGAATVAFASQSPEQAPAAAETKKQPDPVTEVSLASQNPVQTPAAKTPKPVVQEISNEYDEELGAYVITYEDGTKAYLAVDPNDPNVTIVEGGMIVANDYLPIINSGKASAAATPAPAAKTPKPVVQEISNEYDEELGAYVITYEDGTKAYLDVDSVLETTGCSNYEIVEGGVITW